MGMECQQEVRIKRHIYTLDTEMSVAVRYDFSQKLAVISKIQPFVAGYFQFRASNLARLTAPDQAISRFFCRHITKQHRMLPKAPFTIPRIVALAWLNTNQILLHVFSLARLLAPFRISKLRVRVSISS